MPRSRSRSIESSTCSRIWRASTVWVISRMRSASVDLPWSMWAMIEKLRMRDCTMWADAGWASSAVPGYGPVEPPPRVAGGGAAGPDAEPAGDHALDLARLGDPHRMDGEGVDGGSEHQ